MIKIKTGFMEIPFVVKSFFSFVLFLSLLQVHVSAQPGPRSADFFRPAPDIGSKYSADKIYPQGRIFPFSYYSVGGGSVQRRGELLPEKEVQAALRTVKEQGATMIGPQYELNERAPADARAHGLKVFFTVGFSMEEVSGKDAKPIDELVEKIRGKVKAVMDDETIAWWNLTPEELRSWRPREREYLERAANAIRDTDPLKRPVWMYDPGHRNASALATTARRLDIVGKGMYVNYSGMRDSRVWCRWTIEQEKKAIADANPSAIPIAVPEMFQQPADERLHLIPSWVRHDAYLTLVSGAKGIVVFSRSLRPNFPAHAEYAQAWGQVSGELCGEMNLGQVFLFGERRDDLSVDVVEGPKTVSMVFPNGGVKEPIEYPSVSYANIAWGRQRYLFLVNSANEPVSVMVGLYPYGNTYVREIFGKEEPFLLPEGDFQVDLPPLGVKCYKAAWGKD